MATIVTGHRLDPPVRLTRHAAAFVLGVPLAWGAVLLFHPTGDGDRFYPIVREQVTPWLVVHLATMVFVPLMAVVLVILLRGVNGRAARVSRLAIPVFAVFYTAWEAVLGIGTGVLVDVVNETSVADRASGAALVEDYAGSDVVRALEYTGNLAWLVAVVAAAIALRNAHSLHWGVVVLFVVSAPLIAAHVTPFGPVGLVLFVIAVVIVGQRSARTSDVALPVAVS